MIQGCDPVERRNILAQLHFCSAFSKDAVFSCTEWKNLCNAKWLAGLKIGAQGGQ